MSDIVTPEFKEGELFVYLNGDRWELGMVKRKAEDGKYFCWYSRGDTAACTPVECMHKLINAGWTHIEEALDLAIRQVCKRWECPSVAYGFDDECEQCCDGTDKCESCWSDYFTKRRWA